MYIYEKKSIKGKVITIAVLSTLLVVATGYLWLSTNGFEDPVIPVISNDDDTIPVLSIPDLKPSIETIALPYTVDAQTVLHYFDANKSDSILVSAVTEFEGVFRPNQGIDYAYDNKVFEAVASISGTVTDVREDAMFGKTVTVESTDGVSITYQSLSQVAVAAGQEIEQGGLIGLAGENIYNKSLGIHLHVVVEKDGHLVDPETVIGLRTEEIK